MGLRRAVSRRPRALRRYQKGIQQHPSSMCSPSAYISRHPDDSRRVELAATAGSMSWRDGALPGCSHLIRFGILRISTACTMLVDSVPFRIGQIPLHYMNRAILSRSSFSTRREINGCARSEVLEACPRLGLAVYWSRLAVGQTGSDRGYIFARGAAVG